MTRIAFTADTHADVGTKWEEHCRVMDWMAADIEARKPDLVCHGGDVFEGQSTPTERAFVADWIQRITEVCPLVIVAGNHDKTGDVEFMARLRTHRHIIAVERPGVHVVAGVAVACLPWPRTANLLAALGPVSHEQAGQVAVEALRSILTGLGAELARYAGPRVLLSHAMVDGSKTDSRQPIVGADLTISVADLALSRPDLCVVGHIHAEQEFRFDGLDIIYPGCPYHRTFGEPGPTSYLVAEFDEHVPTWRRIAVPATPMLLLETQWAPEHVGLPGDVVVPAGFTTIDTDHASGAEVRLRYHVPSDRREAARAAVAELKARMIADGAVRVQPEEVVEATVRARAPEVAAARTIEDKLVAHWASKGIELADERRARVLARVKELQA